MVKYNPKAVGERSEAMILAQLLLAGEVVLQPFGDNQRYDLVIERDGDFLRVQCKTGRIKNGKVEFQCCSKAGGGPNRDYRGQIELFGVFCPDNGKVYLVPVDHVPTTIASLRVTPPSPKGPKSTLRWAEDYLYPPLTKPMDSLYTTDAGWSSSSSSGS